MSERAERFLKWRAVYQVPKLAREFHENELRVYHYNIDAANFQSYHVKKKIAGYKKSDAITDRFFSNIFTEISDKQVWKRNGKV